MPKDYLEFRQIREGLSRPEEVASDGFRILSSICRLVDEGEFPQAYQEFILRALDKRELFGSAGPVLDALVRQVGLFPYTDPRKLGAADEIAWEFHRPTNMPEGIVFHEPQALVYRAILNGRSVVLSAPTSFGKSLITDAIVASEKYDNILIVVPTIALIDETRRRLSQRFGRRYKIITHASQEVAAKNLFVLTQERVLERDVIGRAEIVVIDEFYKLAPGRDEDERCARLNEVFYRTLKAKKQFYLLGPNVRGLAKKVKQSLDCEEFYEDYRTVVSEVHNVNPGKDPLKTLGKLCQTLTEPTIIFCSSPQSAARVAQAITPIVNTDEHGAAPAADWVAEHYHPDWHFVAGLRNGIGIHHGRIPRALAQYAVRAFNSNVLRFLVCTSTLIEGVNTKAKHVVIFDGEINRKRIDLFTFNNIKGRSGRMGQHYIGHVYLFNAAPQDQLPFVDIPALTQPEDALPSLLLQIDETDLSSTSKKRLEEFKNQELLSYETLKQNIGIDPQAQIDVAKEIWSNLRKYSPLLQWTGVPRYSQIYGICELIWKPFKCSRLGAGSALSWKQLGLKLIALQRTPETRKLIEQEVAFHHDVDKSVENVLAFQRLWAAFHFPQLLRALDRIQKDIFRKRRTLSGDYGVYAAKVEHRFLPPALIALEEYGIPVELAIKLNSRLQPFETLDDVLSNLRRLKVETLNLSAFEQELLKDTQSTL